MSACERKMPSMPFVKPPGPLRVWKTLKGVKKDENDKPVTFTIQEIPEDRYDDVIQHMQTYFVRDEPICSSFRGHEDPDFLESCAVVWRELLKEGIAVAAFVDKEKNEKPEIAGVNVLAVDLKDHEIDLDEVPLQSATAKKVMKTMVNLDKEARVYETYNVDKHMYAFGLSVNPSYRGQALGEHILRVREDIGRAYNIPVTSTVFTSPISQKLAARVGFEVLLEKDCKDILDEEGNEVFPYIKVKTFKIMGKRLY